MTRNYSDPPSLIRVLAALVSGCQVDPPPSDQRDRLLALAREHRVEQLAAWQITKRRGDLSLWFGEASEALGPEARSAAMVDAIRQRELREVLSRISMVGNARPLLFKGAALGYTHYPQSWLRPRLDTDVLISPSSTEEVFKAFSEGGYVRVNSNSGTLVMSQVSFLRTDTFGVSHAFDLHWKIANWHLIARVASHAELAARAVALPSLGSAARTVSNVDALLLACLHRAAHHRDSQELLWIYDIHLLVERFTSEEWTLLLALATRGQVKALCYRGLTLAADLFDTSIPDHVADDLAAARQEPSAIYLSRDIRLVDGLLSDLRTMPLREGVRLLVEHIWPPVGYMRQKYGVTSRRSLLACYARRLATGVPRWLSPGGWS